MNKKETVNTFNNSVLKPEILANSNTKKKKSRMGGGLTGNMKINLESWKKNRLSIVTMNSKNFKNIKQ